MTTFRLEMQSSLARRHGKSRTVLPLESFLSQFPVRDLNGAIGTALVTDSMSVIPVIRMTQLMSQCCITELASTTDSDKCEMHWTDILAKQTSAIPVSRFIFDPAIEASVTFAVEVIAFSPFDDWDCAVVGSEG